MRRITTGAKICRRTDIAWIRILDGEGADSLRLSPPGDDGFSCRTGRIGCDIFVTFSHYNPVKRKGPD